MSINTEQFLEDARKLTEQRMAAAENIAQAISVRVAAEEALKEAESEERKAYREAERHGWTKTELNRLKPVKRRRSSQKKTTTTKVENTDYSSSSQNGVGVNQESPSGAHDSGPESGVMGNV
jgi:Tfp pilus assembly protein PilX